jgi:uncharacterized membrane protein
MQTSIRPDVIAVLAVVGILILLPVLFAALPLSKSASRTAAISLGVAVALLVFAAFLFDMLFGVSALWSFSLGVLVLGMIPCLAIRLRHQSRFALVALGAITVFVVLQHILDLSPVKPYKRFFAAIQPGMTETEVMTKLDQQFPTDGAHPVPVRHDFRTNEISFALDPKESAWNAEAIVIHLDNGRVVSKEYWRD